MPVEPQLPLTVSSPGMYYPQHHLQTPNSIENPSSQILSEKPPSEQHTFQRATSSILTRDSVISHPFSPKLSFPPSPSSIASSAVKRNGRTSEMELGVEPIHVKVSYPPRAQLDPEKQIYPPQTPISPTHASITDQDVMAALYDQREVHDSLPHMPNKKALKILV
jgi:hypothetical protein